MRKDYEGLKARYYNDTQESQMTGRSNVFVEVMSIVDDFERAKVWMDVCMLGPCFRIGRMTGCEDRRIAWKVLTDPYPGPASSLAHVHVTPRGRWHTSRSRTRRRRSWRRTTA